MTTMQPAGKLRLYYFAAWIIYAALTLAGVICHEPNRDEAQAWLIVRDLNLQHILSQLSVKGHPGLWYFLLFPFVKAGFPYITMHLIHWLFGITTAGIILFRCHLSATLKLLFVFSYFMLFEYIIPARNYSLSILILSLICSMYEKRFSKPVLFSFLIFLLFNTNIHSFGAAAALGLIFIMECYNRRILIAVKLPIAIIVSGAVLVILQLLPSPGNAADVTVGTTIFPHSFIDAMWNILTGVQNSFIPVQSEYEELKVALVFTSFFVILLIIHFKKIIPFIFLLISTSWLFYIFCTRLSGSWRHEGLILVFSFFSMWLAEFYRNNNQSMRKLETGYELFLNVCLLISFIFGFSSLRKEYQYDFSGSKPAAAFIIDHHLEKREIACYRSWRASAIAPYLPEGKLWFIDRKEYGSYFILDSVYQKEGDSLSEEEIITRVKTKYPDDALLLLNEPLSLRNDLLFSAKLLYKNSNFNWGADDESFYLYELKFSGLTH
jgi:hypothetical protein